MMNKIDNKVGRDFIIFFCCIGKIEDFEYTIKKVKDNTKSPYRTRGW